MSCMLLTHQHFATLVEAGLQLDLISSWSPVIANDMGAKLATQNLAAFKARYEGRNLEDVDQAAYESYDHAIWEVTRDMLLPLYVWRQARCFEYQAIDDPKYEGGEVERFVSTLINRTATEVLDELADDQHVPWGVGA